MSSGFQVSALNLVMGHIEGQKTRPSVPGESLTYGLFAKAVGQPLQVVIDPGHYVPFPINGVISWRDELSAKYLGQLGEELSWDETSPFLASEDFADSAYRDFLYIAARIAMQGDAAVRDLAGTAEPHYKVAWSVIEQSAKRGFGGRFSQLLLGVGYWLPFRRNMIIEEPDPRGSKARFGSLPSLAQELDDIRDVIAQAHRNATVWTSQQDTVREDVLIAAWQGSDAMQRMCSVALARHLPMFIVG